MPEVFLIFFVVQIDFLEHVNFDSWRVLFLHELLTLIYGQAFRSSSIDLLAKLLLKLRCGHHPKLVLTWIFDRNAV